MSKMEMFLLALSVISLVLHALKDRTKTKVDDVAAEVVDSVKDRLTPK